jgi:hypothetical protein
MGAVHAHCTGLGCEATKAHGGFADPVVAEDPLD